MVVYFEHRYENKFSNIIFLDDDNFASIIPYSSYMNSGFSSCYVDVDKFNPEQCYISYITYFMEYEYKKYLRKYKLKRLL